VVRVGCRVTFDRAHARTPPFILMNSSPLPSHDQIGMPRAAQQRTPLRDGGAPYCLGTPARASRGYFSKAVSQMLSRSEPRFLGASALSRIAAPELGRPVRCASAAANVPTRKALSGFLVFLG